MGFLLGGIKLKYYTILFRGHHGFATSHIVQTDRDLINDYKNALLQGNQAIIWEDKENNQGGILNASEIVGVISNN